MIWVLILNWNQAEETKECLQSVLSLNTPHYEVLVIDNGSSESLPEMPGFVHVLRNEKNLGFAEGNNRGIAYALEHGAEYLFLLNNDARVDPEVLNAFLEAMKFYPDAGILGAKIYYYSNPGTLWYAGGGVHPKWGRCYHEGITESDDGKKWDVIQDTGYACGCALFVKASVVKEVGAMDPAYFLIWEEIDWCYRIRKVGYRCLFVPKARVWHKVSTSFEGGGHGPLWQYYYSRNRLRFLKKHHPTFFETPVFWQEVIKLIFQLCNPWLNKKERALKRAALMGIADYFRGRFGGRAHV